MNRREALVLGGTAALFGAVGGALTGCNKEDVISWGQVVVTSLEQCLPIFKESLPKSVPILENAIVAARALLTALKSNSGNTAVFLRQLTDPDGLINQLIDASTSITDQHTREIVSSLLLAANVALRLIAEHYSTSASVAKKMAVPSNSLERALIQLKF